MKSFQEQCVLKISDRIVSGEYFNKNRRNNPEQLSIAVRGLPTQLAEKVFQKVLQDSWKFSGNKEKFNKTVVAAFKNHKKFPLTKMDFQNNALISDKSLSKLLKYHQPNINYLDIRGCKNLKRPYSFWKDVPNLLTLKIDIPNQNSIHSFETLDELYPMFVNPTLSIPQQQTALTHLRRILPQQLDLKKDLNLKVKIFESLLSLLEFYHFDLPIITSIYHVLSNLHIVESLEMREFHRFAHILLNIREKNLSPGVMSTLCMIRGLLSDGITNHDRFQIVYDLDIIKISIKALMNLHFNSIHCEWFHLPRKPFSNVQTIWHTIYNVIIWDSKASLEFLRLKGHTWLHGHILPMEKKSVLLSATDLEFFTNFVLKLDKSLQTAVQLSKESRTKRSNNMKDIAILCWKIVLPNASFKQYIRWQKQLKCIGKIHDAIKQR